MVPWLCAGQAYRRVGPPNNRTFPRQPRSFETVFRQFHHQYISCCISSIESPTASTAALLKSPNAAAKSTWFGFAHICIGRIFHYQINRLIGDISRIFCIIVIFIRFRSYNGFA
jgi:hypothetical protein